MAVDTREFETPLYQPLIIINQAKNMKVKISDIIIKKRIREDVGDLSKLRESMNKDGLINPIVISDTMELIAGFRRLRCAVELGWSEIECKIVKINSELQKLRIEANENIARKDFTPDEIITIENREAYLKETRFGKFIILVRRFFSRIIARLKAIFK